MEPTIPTAVPLEELEGVNTGFSTKVARSSDALERGLIVPATVQSATGSGNCGGSGTSSANDRIDESLPPVSCKKVPSLLPCLPAGSVEENVPYNAEALPF